MSSDGTDRDSLFSSSGSSEDSEERNHDPHNNNNNHVLVQSCCPPTTSTEENAENPMDDNEDGSINHGDSNNIEEAAAAAAAAEEESKESKEVQQSTDKEEEPSEQVATVEGNVQDDTGQETSPPQNQSSSSTSIVQPNDTFTPPTTNGIGRRMVEFDVEAIREQVTCRLCHGLYREPYTTLKCFHTFCKSCLATALHSSKFSNSESFNACPQCQLYLGRHADPASVALPDRTLESLLDKVLFPQLARDDDLAEQLFYQQLHIERKELPGELLLQRQQQQQAEADSPRTAPESQRKRPRFNAQEAWEQSHAVRVTTTTVLFQLVCSSQETTTTTAHTLKLPFLKTEGTVRVEQLKRYILQKLNLEANNSNSRKHVVMQCHSVVLPDTMTVAQIEDSIWEKYSSNQNTIMQLSYTLGSTSSTDQD